METKYVRVPFEVELAKKITSRKAVGRIVTRCGLEAKIISFDGDCSRHIHAEIIAREIETSFSYYYDDKGTDGTEFENGSDLFIEIPEYLTFKDGDVIAYDNVKDVFFIIGSKCSITDESPHYYVKYEKGYITFGTEDSFCRLKGSRLATEEEKQKLIDSLKASKEPKAKEYLKRFFNIEQKQEYEFNPFDKVLVRDNGGFWICSLFSHISKKQDKYKYITVTGSFENCIPYNEQTAHLLGTTENYE